jgi:hypothetical protein
VSLLDEMPTANTANTIKNLPKDVSKISFKIFSFLILPASIAVHADPQAVRDYFWATIAHLISAATSQFGPERTLARIPNKLARNHKR